MRGGGASASPPASFSSSWSSGARFAFNGCERIEGYATAASLPRWARETLQAYSRDPTRRYSFAALEAARTGDEIWNAASVSWWGKAGVMGNLRMLWGKKILE